MKKAGKVFALILFSILFVSLISTVVSAAGEWSGAFRTLFTDWSGGNLGANTAKIFFFVMVSLLIYLLLSGIMPKNATIVMILSGIVSFLATAYITPSEIYSILISYSALGLTLTTLVPLAILFGLTYRAASTGNVQMAMLQYFGWILFAVYSVYRFIYDWAYAQEGSAAVNGIILATAVVAAIVALFNSSIRRLIARQYIISSKEAAKTTISEATAFLEQTSKAEREISKRE